MKLDKLKMATIWDYPDSPEVPKGASLTQPDEAFTVRELFERMNHGQSLLLSSNYGGYEDEPDFDDIDLGQAKDLDLYDKHMIKEQQQLFFQELQKEQEQQQKPSNTQASVVASDDQQSEGGIQEAAQEPATKQTTKKPLANKSSQQQQKAPE